MEENILCLFILPLMTGLTQPCDSLHHFEGSCENGVAPEWVQAATRKKMTGCAWGTGRLPRRIILCACLPAFISSSNTSLKTSQGKSFTVPFISQLGRKGYLFQKVDSGVFWHNVAAIVEGSCVTVDVTSVHDDAEYLAGISSHLFILVWIEDFCLGWDAELGKALSVPFLSQLGSRRATTRS